jgi:hypothetical protein
MKVAIYVEGITEAAFVYQLIGEKYQWDWTKLRLECLNLDPLDAADDLRDFGLEEASDYFLIYDSCSDTSVASDIRERFQSHKDQGFDKVVGLRDVFSESYVELYGRNYNSQHIVNFIHDIQEPFQLLDASGFVQIRFAVMETEAWLLALSSVFQKIDCTLDANGLRTNVGIDINDDPQTTYFHPYSKLEDIYKSIGRTYSKHWHEIKEIVFKVKWEDFQELYNSGKCQSFRGFYDSIFA